jgi:acetyl esterase/lipase
MRVVYTVPGMDQVTPRRNLSYKMAGETPLLMDVYSPAGREEGRPYVLLVHGGPVDARYQPKDWAIFVSIGELLAVSGFVALTFNHRFTAGDRLQDAGADVEAARGYARDHSQELGLDADRGALWAFSGGGVFLSPLLSEPSSSVKALVAYYAILDIQELPPGAGADTVGAETRRRFSPVLHVGAGSPPILVARAGRDHPFLNATIDRFVHQALSKNAALHLVNHPEGRHGFDVVDDTDRSREIVALTLSFLKTHL